MLEFFGGSLLSHEAIAGGPLLLAAVGREQILDMLSKVWRCYDLCRTALN